MARLAPFWPHTCPAFHSIRLAIRAAITQHSNFIGEPIPGVVVGLSGGADSLALAAACAAETLTPAGSLYDGYVHAVIVDHGLQDGSAEVAAEAARQADSFGASAHVVRVHIPQVAGGVGPEASAREARHGCLRAIAIEHGAPLLLAHTLDDQAETMLLRLARGGGPQALSAMSERTVWSDGAVLLRPLLETRRADTLAACAELGLTPWHDPQNHDRQFTRVRVRHDILPMLEETLGPGVAENLAKTATLAREDNEALDDLARAALAEAQTGNDAGGGGLSVVAVAKQYGAVQTRMIRKWILDGGGEPGTKQISDVLTLVNHYHGQGPVFIPKGAHLSGTRLVVARKGGTLALSELSAIEQTKQTDQTSAEGQRKGRTDA